MSITVTKTAEQRITNFVNNRDNTIGIRLGVKTSGCSGMAYVLEFVDNTQEEDEIFDFDTFKIIVDKKSLVYLAGTELDFVKEGLQEGFQFNNPNAKAECGCGESFTV